MRRFSIQCHWASSRDRERSGLLGGCFSRLLFSLPSATRLFFPMVFLLSLAFFDPPQEEICSLRIHNGVNFIFTASGREKGDSFFRWS